MEFWRGIEDPRSDRIYSSGNRRVKKGPGPRGTRDEEFLVPSLISTDYKTALSFQLVWQFCEFFDYFKKVGITICFTGFPTDCRTKVRLCTCSQSRNSHTEMKIEYTLYSV